MGFIAEHFPEFSQKFEEIDKMYAQKRHIDEKTYQFIINYVSSKLCTLVQDL
jgi:alkylhydroperoxidase/carboxymuconolactone decarboxylase family protein YurZ